MQLKHGFARAAAVAVLMMGTSPMALMAETPADTLVVADAIDDIVSIDPHEAFEFSGVDLNNNVYDTLVELDPLNARAQASLGFILNINGDWEQALVPLAKAVALAPSIEEVRSHQARALSALGRMDEAAVAAEQERNEAYRLVARSYLRGPGADQALAEFMAKYGEEMPGYVAHLYGSRGEADPAFAWFDRALIRRDAPVVWDKTNVNLRSLHSDPRWPVLLRKLGLADDQLK